MTYYIDYNDLEKNSLFERILYKFILKIEVINVDNNKNVIYINKKYINKRAYKKIDSFLNKKGYKRIDSVLVSKNVRADSSIEGLYKPSEKHIMKAMTGNLLKKMEAILKTDFRNEDVSITMCNTDNKELFFDIANRFKSVNIVTTKIGNMRRFESSIKDKDIIMAISNNRRKSLKRARILINIDFNNNVLNEFEINRNCIIINLNNNKIKLCNKFQGCIIENIDVDFVNRFYQIKKENFDINYLYDSYLDNLKYRDASYNTKYDRCKIINLQGNNGFISNQELMNIYTNSAIKLDKTQKKD